MKERRTRRNMRLNEIHDNPPKETINSNIKERKEELVSKTTRSFSKVVKLIKGSIIRSQEGSFTKKNRQKIPNHPKEKEGEERKGPPQIKEEMGEQEERNYQKRIIQKKGGSRFSNLPKQTKQVSR